jgi:hypothetical protein
VSSYPLRAILHNPNATGNVAKWAAELAKFELDFASRHVIKSQVGQTSVTQGPELRSSPDPTGHSSSTSPRVSRGSAGVLLLTPQRDQFKYMVHLDFKASNNMAEYEALLFGLSTALSLGVRQLLVKGDFQLIIKQVKGDCCCHDP